MTRFLCSDYFRMVIAISGKKDLNNGLHVIEGNGGSTNYRSMAVSGTLMLRKDQYASVFVYSHNDPAYVIHHESGFSCNRFATKIGFHADKVATQGAKAKSWTSIKGFTTAGNTGLYSIGGGFSGSTGLYTAPQTGTYFCAALMRLDHAKKQANNPGTFELTLTLQGSVDKNNGFYAIEGNSRSQNYLSMGVSGTIHLSKGANIGVSVFTSSTTSFQIQSESGFSCHMMLTAIGFHASVYTKQQFSAGWSMLKGWESKQSVNKELYALGGGTDNLLDGAYVAPKTGYYICTTQVRLDSADKSSYFRVILALNKNINLNHGNMNSRFALSTILVFIPYI